MKISRIAVASFGLFATTAFAQSTVTLYGVADAGIEYLSNVPSASPGGSSQVRMTSGNMSTSRWGMRGVEDLGVCVSTRFDGCASTVIDGRLRH
ncbi:porin, partial [Cupriavidus pauculus]